MNDRLKNRLNTLNERYVQEQNNKNLSIKEHGILHSIAYFQNELTMFSESVLFQQGKAKQAEENMVNVFYHTSFLKTKLEYPAQIKNAYKEFKNIRNALVQNMGKHLSDNQMTAYNIAKDNLNVTIKTYLEKADKEHGCHYFDLARYSELKLSSSAKSIVKQREEALIKYEEIKLSHPVLTYLQHDFIANLAFYRHELHVNADNFLVSSGVGKDIETVFHQLVNHKIFDLMGFSLPNQMFVAYNAMVESRNNAIASVDQPDFYDKVSKFIDDKENFNTEIEKFLEHVDSICHTTYSPSKDHRLDPEIAKNKDIMACLVRVMEEHPDKPVLFTDIHLPERQPRVDINSIIENLPDFSAKFDEDITMTVFYSKEPEGQPQRKTFTIPKESVIPVSILKSGTVIIEPDNLSKYISDIKELTTSPVSISPNIIKKKSVRVFDAGGNLIDFHKQFTKTENHSVGNVRHRR